jgi:hypothetical protein
MAQDQAHGRTLRQAFDELREQTEAFQRDPAHNLPRCACCHNFVRPPRLRETPNGPWSDTAELCGFCRAEKSEEKFNAEQRERNKEDNRYLEHLENMVRYN